MTQVLDDRKNMTPGQAKPSAHSYFATHHHEVAAAGRPTPPWLARLRRAGIARFEQVGFPNAKQELWRWTNLAPLTRTAFEPAGVVGPDLARPLVEEYTLRREGAAEVVLVNGHFSPELSQVGKLPRGVRVSGLAQAVASEADQAVLERHLGKYASIERNPFVALNTGLVRDGAYVFLPAGTKLQQPIHVLLIATGGEKPVAAHPRVLVVAEDDVEATIVESYVGERDNPRAYFTNAVTEIVAGAGCHIDHCRLQQESLAAFHVSTMQVELGRGTHVVSHACTIGGRITRNDLNCVMNGEGAYATLNGLVLIGGEQHVDNHTLLHHEKPNCPSHELYKHVLDGRASAVFKGQIFVQKDAQKTDSKQTSKTLLLSDDAYMNSQPALEIYADDVKCTHGSTTGPVDEDMVFYLRTRGISLEAARHVLTYAFAADITRRIRVEPVRRRIEDYMAAQHGLPQDLRITDVTVHDQAVL